MMNTTDSAWIRWGERDPYFAVITDSRYRGANMTPEAKAAFFESGRHHVGYVLQTCRQLNAAFAPQRVLDFGCGVGRVLLPLAEVVERVVGVDVSPAMLAEARKNCAEQGLGNVELLPSDDELSAVEGLFDLVHSCIVFQHIDIPRGRRLFSLLLDRLAPGGMGAIHVTFGKAHLAQTWGQPPMEPVKPIQPATAGPVGFVFRQQSSRVSRHPDGDPEMQMNSYNLSELAFAMQRSGVRQFQAQFTDHGGELGVFLFFAKPAE
jgi:SAM-dependent methyltransferase